MGSEKDAIRLFILQMAWQQIGAHYVKGSDGGFPGEIGVKKSVDLMEESAWDDLAVHAAQTGFKVCEGRTEIFPGRYLDPNDKTDYQEFKDYVAEQSAKHISTYYWEPYKGKFYPRRLNGKGSAICLGEDCRSRRHFDCIGFVNWVLTNALGKPVAYSTAQFQGDKNKGGIGEGVVAPAKVIGEGSNFPTLKNADILTKIDWKWSDKDGKWKVSHDHIGFYVEGGKVLEASGKAVGVVLSGYNRSDWDAVSRIHDYYLKFGA